MSDLPEFVTDWQNIYEILHKKPAPKVWAHNRYGGWYAMEDSITRYQRHDFEEMTLRLTQYVNALPNNEAEGGK